jgi:membrane protein
VLGETDSHRGAWGAASNGERMRREGSGSPGWLRKGRRALAEQFLRPWRRGEASWRDLVRGVWRGLYAGDITDQAAQLAYYFLFSVFPLLLFLTTLIGYIVADSAALRNQLYAYINGVLPSGQVTTLIRGTIREVLKERGGAKLSFGLVAAVWVASNGMVGVIRSLNDAFEVGDPRSWWRRRLVAIGLTLGFSSLVLLALVLVFYGGALGLQIAASLHLSALTGWHIARWMGTFVTAVVAFDLVYNLAPRLRGYRWRWFSPGALLGAMLWLASSLGLQGYVLLLNSFSRAYGSLGAVIVLLVWFYLSGVAILLGGTLNAEMCKAAAGACE